MPCLLLGKATKSKLQTMPIPAGSTSKSLLASSEGSGLKQLTTFLSNKAMATNTNTEVNAWKKSINLNLYFEASSAWSDVVPSTSQRPLNVTTPHRTLPLSSLKLSVKHRRKHEMQQKAKRANVMAWLVMVWHWPWCVKIGDRIWNIRTVPVGRSFDKCVEPLNVFLMAFWVGVLGFFGMFFKRGWHSWAMASIIKILIFYAFL